MSRTANATRIAHPHCLELARQQSMSRDALPVEPLLRTTYPLLHLVTLAGNFVAGDSVIYDPKEGLTCIQITINKEHPILVLGLERIQSWLKSGTPLEDLRPSKRKPWHFIFILPSDMGSFKSQRLRGDTAQGEWAGEVHQ